MSIGVIFREINVAATTGTPKFCTPGFACQKIEIEDFFSCRPHMQHIFISLSFFFLIKKLKYLIPPKISRNSKQKLNLFFCEATAAMVSTEFCNGKSVSGRNHSFSERKKIFWTAHCKMCLRTVFLHMLKIATPTLCCQTRRKLGW